MRVGALSRCYLVGRNACRRPNIKSGRACAIVDGLSRFFFFFLGVCFMRFRFKSPATFLSLSHHTLVFRLEKKKSFGKREEINSKIEVKTRRIERKRGGRRSRLNSVLNTRRVLLLLIYIEISSRKAHSISSFFPPFLFFHHLYIFSR